MDDQSAVGAFYATKAELLADLERYAASYGCAEAAPVNGRPPTPSA